MPTVDYAQKRRVQADAIQAEPAISDRNKAILAKFQRDLATEDFSDARIHKLAGHLKLIAQWADWDFDEATEDDLRDAVAWVQSRDLQPSTKNDYKIAIKRFYKWLNGGEHPEKVAWIITTEKATTRKLPEDLLDEDDVLALLAHATNHRTAAFMAMVWETGARAGELLDLKIKHLQTHEYGLQVVISGKTGPRRLPLITAVPHLNRWLDAHPRGDDRTAPLWVEVHAQDHGHGKELGAKVSYHALKRDVERTATRAGIEKPVNPHHWRHSRATYLANKFTEAQMCEWFGWVQGSKMPAKYVHLSGRDIDGAYGALHGKVEEEEQAVKTAPVTCGRCGFENRPEARWCDQCGSPVSAEIAYEFQQQEEQMTAEATDDDMALALRLVQALNTDRTKLEAVLDDIVG